MQHMESLPVDSTQLLKFILYRRGVGLGDQDDKIVFGFRSNSCIMLPIADERDDLPSIIIR